MFNHIASALRQIWKFGPSLRPLLLILLVIGASLLATATWSPVALEYLFREPYSIGHIPLYVGLISNIGALLWCCTIGICLFAYLIARKNTRSAAAGNMLLFPAVFSAVLLLDDVLMIHERVIGPLLPNGQMVTYLVYGFAAGFFLYRYRTALLSSNLGVLMLSIGLLGASAGLDVLKEVFSINVVPARHHLLVEDGLKLMGIATWLYYFSHLSRLALEAAWKQMELNTVAMKTDKPEDAVEAGHALGLVS